jgi:hypothetical protein
MGEMRGRRRKRRSTMELEEAKVNWYGCEDFVVFLLIIVLVKDILSLLSMANGNGK